MNEILPPERKGRRLAPAGRTIGELAGVCNAAVDRIHEHWQKGVGHFIEIGQVLVDLKADLPHGVWAEFIDSRLPFSRKTAAKLMAIAQDPRLSNDAQLRVICPPHWDTLYRLSTLDDEAFNALRSEGVIRPELSRAELKVALARLGVAARGPAPDLATLPAGKYRTIYADPAYEFRTWSAAGKDRSQEAHYPTMTLEEICALPVAQLCAKDTALFLWGQWDSFPDCRGIGEAWGFRYVTCAFVWVKTGAFGKGYWTRHGTEPCLLFTRGAPERLNADVAQVIEAPRRDHSQKPEETYARIERLVAGPYLELFANPPARDGWDTWGQPHREA